MTRATRIVSARNEQVGLAAALMLLGALVVGLVWHAESRARSHRATAEDALRHHATVAAWQYHRFATEELFHTVHGWTAPLAPMLHRSERTTPSRSKASELPRRRADGCSACGAAAVQPNYTFRLDLAAAAPTLTVVDSARRPPSLADRAVLAARLGTVIGTGVAHEHEPHGLFVDTIGGTLRAVAYGVVRRPGRAREAFGVDLDAVHLASPLSNATRGALLPPGLLRGTSSDSVLHVEVRTPGGALVYESGRRPRATIVAADTLDPRFGALVATVTLRPEHASALVIGGVPRTNWPLFGAVLSLAALLTALALLQLRRMRELARLRSRFVASVSHELRTPLAQISMFSETLLLDRARSDAERVDFLSAIFREARRLSNLVESVLRFSRSDGAPARQRLTPEPQDVSAEVHDVLRGFAPLAAASDVELRPEVEPGIAATLEPGAIRQMLLNLLDNAVKYGPRGQTVAVRLRAVNGSLQLSVDDEGPGIPAEDRVRVFEPFARIEDSGRSRVAGTGIGLSVVRDIATAHGGRAWIESAESRGVRAIVELPRLAGGHARAEPLSASLSSAQSHASLSARPSASPLR